MRRALPIIAFLLLGVGVSAAVWRSRTAAPTDLLTNDFTAANTKHFETKEQEAAGLCPWRNQSADMQSFFPGSDSAIETNLVVSSKRIETTKRLGRTPTGDENALRVYKIKKGPESYGTVIARRVRGEYGLIELVLAVDSRTGAIKRAQIQRLREPEPSATALKSTAWLRRFNGMTADSNWQPVAHSSVLPAQALTSAEAIADTARTTLILLSTAQSIRVAVPQQ